MKQIYIRLYVTQSGPWRTLEVATYETCTGTIVGLSEASGALAGVRRGGWSLLKPLQVFNEVAGSLADPW